MALQIDEESDPIEEGRIVNKGEEKDVLYEDFYPIHSYDPLTLERVVKLIETKMEIGARVKVYKEPSQGGLYFPVTKTGATLVMAYRQVGFSYIPVLEVEKPEGEKDKTKAEKFLQYAAFNPGELPHPERNWVIPGTVVGAIRRRR